MRLTIVGCSGSYPGPESPASCYLVEAEHEGRPWRALLDLGSGALGRLHDFVDPREVDAVFLSHLHPDHCFDLSGYYVLRKYHPAGSPPRIPVHGPAGTGAHLAAAYGLPPDPGMSEEFDFRSYDGEPARVGPFTVTHTQVCHPVETYALRVEVDGRSLVYSGDTGPCPRLAELAEGADLLLAEASFQEGADNPPDLHLTGKQAAELAVEAAVGSLVLTHVPPWYDPETAYDEARTVYDGRLDVATSGATYQI